VIVGLAKALLEVDDLRIASCSLTRGEAKDVKILISNSQNTYLVK
jgi:hypothetical protein